MVVLYQPQNVCWGLLSTDMSKPGPLRKGSSSDGDYEPSIAEYESEEFHDEKWTIRSYRSSRITKFVFNKQRAVRLQYHLITSRNYKNGQALFIRILCLHGLPNQKTIRGSYKNGGLCAVHGESYLRPCSYAKCSTCLVHLCTVTREVETECSVSNIGTALASSKGESIAVQDSKNRKRKVQKKKMRKRTTSSSWANVAKYII